MDYCLDINRIDVMMIIIISNLLSLVVATLIAFSIYQTNDFNNNNTLAQRAIDISDLNSNTHATTMSNHTLSVTGTTTTYLKPDKVILGLGVQTTNKTAGEALTANSDIMNKIINRLRAADVKDNETSTTSFSIRPNYNYSRDLGTVRNISSFTVSNSIQIQSLNINNTGNRIDLAIAAGANNVNNVEFMLSDKKIEETKKVLIQQAINNAKTKADIAASTLGVKVIGVNSISISESEDLLPRGASMRNPSVATGASTDATIPVVISGVKQLSLSVSLIFLIK